MHEYRATTVWHRTTPDFTYDTFNRDHEVRFAGGQTVAWSSAPEFKGNPAAANPEEALVASISTCHMLTFLSIAARKRLVIDSYADEASGVLERNAGGKYWVSRVTLRPKVVFGGDRQPSTEEISALHDAAHENCFVANSVRSAVSVVGA